jgi:splicing factor 3B subunit 2
LYVLFHNKGNSNIYNFIPQVLHDAFFKFQTKPKLTSHGDLYFEGKEFEVRSTRNETKCINQDYFNLHMFSSICTGIVHFQVKLKEMKPGHLSQELKDALGMPEGAPPPWLINMQVCIDVVV